LLSQCHAPAKDREPTPTGRLLPVLFRSLLFQLFEPRKAHKKPTRHMPFSGTQAN